MNREYRLFGKHAERTTKTYYVIHDHFPPFLRPMGTLDPELHGTPLEGSGDLVSMDT